MVRQPGNRSKESSSSSSSSSRSSSSNSRSRSSSSSSSSGSTTFPAGNAPCRFQARAVRWGKGSPTVFVVTSVLLAAAIFLAVVFGRGAGDECFAALYGCSSTWRTFRGWGALNLKPPTL